MGLPQLDVASDHPVLSQAVLFKLAKHPGRRNSPPESGGGGCAPRKRTRSFEGADGGGHLSRKASPRLTTPSARAIALASTPPVTGGEFRKHTPEPHGRVKAKLRLYSRGVGLANLDSTSLSQEGSSGGSPSTIPPSLAVGNSPPETGGVDASATSASGVGGHFGRYFGLAG